MSQAITFKEVWKLFQETDRKFKETDRKFKESEIRFQETERLLKEKSLETDRRFQETERLFKEQNRELSQKLGELGNRLGDFVEWMVEPAVVRLFQERGIDVHQVSQNVRTYGIQNGIEIDLLVKNKTELVAVECKSSVGIDEVKEHIVRLGKIKKFFPEYSKMHLMGAVAGMVFPDLVAKYAVKQGLFVLRQSGENVVIANDKEFKPHIW